MGNQTYVRLALFKPKPRIPYVLNYVNFKPTQTIQFCDWHYRKHKRPKEIAGIYFTKINFHVGINYIVCRYNCFKGKAQIIELACFTFELKGNTAFSISKTNKTTTTTTAAATITKTMTTSTNKLRTHGRVRTQANISKFWIRIWTRLSIK